MFRKKIVVLLLGAFIFRILLMLWSFQHTTNKDIFRYRDWAMIPYVYNSLTAPYEGKHITFGIDPLNMPPGTLYVLTGMYRLNIIAAKVIAKVTHTAPGALQWVNGALTNAFLRLPNILADLLAGYLIYALVRRYRREKDALIASSLYLFNPSIWYNSAFWGQMDAVNSALFFWGIYLYLRHKKLAAALLLFLSLYVKLTLIVIIGPFLALAFLLEKNRKKFLTSVALAVSVILLLTLPLSRAPHLWWYQFLQGNSLGEMHNITSLAFNFWWVVFRPRIAIGKPMTDFEFTLDRFIGSPESSVAVWGTPLFVWALILFGIVSVPLVRILMRHKTTILRPSMLTLSLAMLSLIGYLFLPHMHERYLFAFIPLMAASIGLTGRNLWLFVAISLLNFLNLYLVWHSMIFPALPYWLMNSVDFQWGISVVTVVLGIVLYVRSIRDMRSSARKY